MELRAGYKRTEVGVIPADWEVHPISELAATSSGTTPPRAQFERYFRDGIYSWVKTLDLNNAELFETQESITDFALKEISIQLHQPGAVLVAMYGGFNQIGRTALIRMPACVNQALTAINTDWEKLVPEFLLRVLNHRVGHWKRIASSSRKDPNITGKDIRDFQIPCPPVPEQEAIAEALGDADALIKSLERLIAKKGDLKLGAMQELLRPKDGWTAGKLSDLGIFLKGGGVKKDQCLSGELPCVRYGEIYTMHSEWIRDFRSRISEAVALTATRLKAGDILFAGSGETKAEIGKCVAFIDTFAAYAGGDIVILRPKHPSGSFWGYYLNTAPVN